MGPPKTPEATARYDWMKTWKFSRWKGAPFFMAKNKNGNWGYNPIRLVRYIAWCGPWARGPPGVDDLGWKFLRLPCRIHFLRMDGNGEFHAMFFLWKWVGESLQPRKKWSYKPGFVSPFCGGLKMKNPPRFSHGTKMGSRVGNQNLSSKCMANSGWISQKTSAWSLVWCHILTPLIKENIFSIQHKTS